MKFYLESLGCAKNLVDSEIGARCLEEAGFEQTDDPAEGELIIVNTCAFIESAKQEAIDTILQLASFKQESCRILAVMGCLPERYREELIPLIPEVDLWTGTRDIHRIAELLRAGKKSAFSKEPVPYERLERKRLTPSPWAYLKIAEGCNHRCAFCAIPSIRGPYRSLPVESLTAEAAKLAAAGAREVILVSQDSTAYGSDLYGRRRLTDLLAELASIDDIQWIRVLYCNPLDVSDELLDCMARHEKVCAYLDIPLQHASPKVLRAMRRAGSGGEYLALIERARKKLPRIVVRSTFIVGFPGEESEDNEVLLDFLERARLDRVGVFAWSREEGTPAYRLEPRVPARVARKRLREAMLLQQRISFEKNRALLGTELEVLVEGGIEGMPDLRGIAYAGGVSSGFPKTLNAWGRSRRDAPEVDGRVWLSGDVRTGEIVTARVVGATPYDLAGRVGCDG